MLPPPGDGAAAGPSAGAGGGRRYERPGAGKGTKPIAGGGSMGGFGHCREARVQVRRNQPKRCRATEGEGEHGRRCQARENQAKRVTLSHTKPPLGSSDLLLA